MTKYIFITGAAQGIGRATADLFARNGWKVGGFDIDDVGLLKLKDDLGADTCMTGILDVRSRDAFKNAMDTFLEWSGGRLDCMFNNAGVLFMGPFDEIDPVHHDLLIDVNVKGLTYGTETAMPALKETADKHGSACLLAMSSASAIYGAPEFAVYGATKFFVRGLMEAVDIELSGTNVKVADIMPGFVDTPMVNTQNRKAKILQASDERISPEAIAQFAWDAVHGDKLHYYASGSLSRMDKMGALFPNFIRKRMKAMESNGAPKS